MSSPELSERILLKQSQEIEFTEIQTFLDLVREFDIPESTNLSKTRGKSLSFELLRTEN